MRQAVVLLDIRKVNRRSKEETAVEGNERQPGLLGRHICMDSARGQNMQDN